MGFAEQLKISLYRFSEAARLVEVNWWRAIVYYILLCALAAVIGSVGIRYDFDKLITKACTAIPEFTYKDGELTSGIFNYSNVDMGLVVYVNTNKDASEFNYESCNIAYVLDKDGMTFYNSGSATEFKYTNFMAMDYLDRTTLVGFLDGNGTRTVLFAMFMLAYFGIKTALITNQIIITAAIAIIINNIIINARLKVNCIIKLAIYANTFPVLLMSVVSIFANEIQYISIAVAVIYMVLWLRSCSGIDQFKRIGAEEAM